MSNYLTLAIEPKYLQAAALFASSDATRFVLCGVNLEVSSDGRRVLLVATDGRRLVVLNVTAHADLQDVWNGEHVNIPTTLIAKAPKPGKAGKLVLEVSDSMIRLGTADARIECSRKVCNYPNWQDALPQKPAVPLERFTLNAGYLDTFAKLERLLGGSGAIEVSSSGELDAFTVRGCSPAAADWFGVAAPVRQMQPAGLPEWLK